MQVIIGMVISHAWIIPVPETTEEVSRKWVKSARWNLVAYKRSPRYSAGARIDHRRIRVVNRPLRSVAGPRLRKIPLSLQGGWNRHLITGGCADLPVLHRKKVEQ